MSVITPNTDFILLKNNLELDNRNQLTFSSKQTQFNYFNSLPKLIADSFTYQRQDNTVRFPALKDDILEYNYCMYRNTSYSDKWFYAYITDMEYVSNTVTAITIKTDVFQTWQFDLTYKNSFVEREHVNDDTIGKHTIPEGLETGNYIEQPHTETNLQVNDLYYNRNTYIIIGTSESPNLAVPSGNKQYGGCYSGLYYYAFRTQQNADNFIKYLQRVETEDIIYSVFIIPKSIAPLSDNQWNTVTLEGITFEYGYLPFTSSATQMGSIGINKDNYLDSDYIPKNNKLLCYPYKYLLISNNAGTIQEYKYEYFNSNTCGFNIVGVASPGCSIRMNPINYLEGGREGGVIYGIDAPKLPTCGWNSDSYTNWLTQNSVNIPLNNIKNVVSIVSGAGIAALSGGTMALAGAGLALNGVMGIADTMKTMYEHSLAPVTAKGGANNGDVIFGLSRTYDYYKMSIKKENAKILDSYFSMYGYKVNEVKVPNITGRTNWNYVKTIGCNIEGYIPQKDMQEIKNMFNAGVTFWHNPSTFLDYSQNNTIA